MYTYCGSLREPSIDVRQHSESAACLNGETRDAQPNLIRFSDARFFSARRMDPPGVCFWVGSLDVCESKLSRV